MSLSGLPLNESKVLAAAICYGRVLQRFLVYLVFFFFFFPSIVCGDLLSLLVWGGFCCYSYGGLFYVCLANFMQFSLALVLE